MPAGTYSDVTNALLSIESACCVEGPRAYIKLRGFFDEIAPFRTLSDRHNVQSIPIPGGFDFSEIAARAGDVQTGRMVSSCLA